MATLNIPLAERVRPQQLSDIVGQNTSVGQECLYHSDYPKSII
ncbi:hypothetical protein [Moraxella catarrhalis]|nr:hypothetical protein [Moraxella catarrhalis]